MGLFKNLTDSGLEKTADSLGGYQLFESDIYFGKIKLAYAVQSEGGAHGVALVLDLNGREYNETIYVTNKKGENWFTTDRDPNKKIPLPGFTLINELCMVTVEKPLSEMDSEEKVVNIYDPAERKAVPRGAQVLTELLGQEAHFAILKQLANKNVKNQTTNVYEPSDETREQNALVKAFHGPTKLTLNEVVEASKLGTFPEGHEFYDSWLKKNQGKTSDIRKNKGSGGPKQGAPGQNAPKTSSLFGKS